VRLLALESLEFPLYENRVCINQLRDVLADELVWKYSS